MQRQHVGALEEIFLAGGDLVASRPGALGRALLAPHQDLHAEAVAGRRHQPADGAEPENAERRAAQAVRQRARPVAAPHALGLQRNVAPRRHDQRDGELGRRVRRIALAGGDGNAERGAGGKIDGAGVAPDQREQLEPGQALQQHAGELHPFADGDDDIGVAQPLDELIEVARRLAVARHIVLGDERIAGELVDHVLVVVGNYDFHARVTFIAQCSELARWHLSPPCGEGRGAIARRRGGACRAILEPHTYPPRSRGEARSRDPLPARGQSAGCALHAGGSLASISTKAIRQGVAPELTQA